MDRNLWGADRTYNSIDEKSEFFEKINVVINVFSKNASPDYVKYDKLYLFTTTQEKAFDALLIKTGMDI